MEIQEFVKKTELVPLSELTSLAATRGAFGDDVLTAFKTQIELRNTEASKVLDASTTAGRDTLLASEQRSYDTHVRERDAVLALQLAVEKRTELRAFVPESQRPAPVEIADLSPVLTREQRCSDYLTRRGGAVYAGETGALRFGTMVRALALGDRRGLSDLERRALSEGTDAAGGFTTPEVLGAQFIDRVRSSMVVMKAGAQTVPMTSDILYLARLAQPGATPAPTWKAENAPIIEAGLTLERVTFKAHTLPMLINLSVELSEDSANIDSIIETEMSKAMALELDRVALLGSGTAPEPKGVKAQTGIHTGALPVTPTNWDWLVDATGTLWTSNFEPNAVIHGSAFAVTAAKFKDTVLQPLQKPAALSGITDYRTNQVATDIFLGDFTQLLYGLRTSFRLEVSRLASPAFQNLQIAVRAYLRADVQLAHPEAFVVLS